MFFLQGKVHFGSIPIVNFVPSRVHDMVSRLSMIDLSFFFVTAKDRILQSAH